MSKKEEALEKAFPDGFSLQKMKRMSRRYHKSGGKRSESCILRKKSGWDYQKKGT